MKRILRNIILPIMIIFTMIPIDNIAYSSELSTTDKNKMLGAVASEWYSTNIREWLNSEKQVVNYTANAPTYKSEAGFLSVNNFTEIERNSIATTRHGAGWQYSIANRSLTDYYSLRSVAHNDYLYNDKVFLLHYTDLVNYLERNKVAEINRKKYYSNYLQYTTNKKDSQQYIVNSGYYNRMYEGMNPMYSSELLDLKGASPQNIVPALSLNPNAVMSNGVIAKDLKIGSFVKFGKYNNEPIEWQVINKTDYGYPLLWSSKIITMKEYDAPGDINPNNSKYINFSTYDVDITTENGKAKSWETQKTIDSTPTIVIENESALTTPTNDTKITLKIKATDSKYGIRKIILPDGRIINGGVVEWTLTKNGEYDIIAENNIGVISVRHIITKAINTPAEITLQTDKNNDSKWSNKPVNIFVSSSNNGVYETIAKGSPNMYTHSSYAKDFPNWLQLGGKRLRVTGTFKNVLSDAEARIIDENAAVMIRLSVQSYDSNSTGYSYNLLKEIKLKDLKQRGQINIDDTFVIQPNAYGSVQPYICFMDGASQYQKAPYNYGMSDIKFEILDKEDLKIEQITLPDGNIVKAESVNYKVFNTGVYSFSIKDNRGKIATKNIEIAIDMVKPQLDIISSNPNSTKDNLILKINASDDLSGIKSIKLPNGEYRTNILDKQKLDTEYNIFENGDYTFETEDFAGNKTSKTITINNIDRTAPVITITGNPTNWTNRTIDLRINATDTQSGIKQIIMPSGYIFNNQQSATQHIVKNGSYTFKVVDDADNESSQTIVVDKIDRINPTANIVGNPTTWTNDNVTLNITASDDLSGVKQITLPDGSIKSGTGATYVISTNGYYSVKVKDNAGNELDHLVIVDKIDKTNPTINITGNPTTWTKDNVTLNITASDGQSGIKEIILPDGSIKAGANTNYIVSTNGSYVFKTKDNVGNEISQTVVINKIDKTNPTINITGNPTTWTKDNVTLNITASDSQSGIKEIILPDGSIKAGANTNYIVSTNGSYVFKTKDNVGNEISQTVVINKIDKTNPTINHIINPTTWTNNTVSISITGIDEGGIKEIILPNGSKASMSNVSYTVSENGQYKFSIVDTAGNISTKNIDITNIDKVKPSFTSLCTPSEWTNGSVSIKIDATDNASGVKQIILPDNSIVNNSSTIYTVSTNGNYIFKVRDNAGNEETKTITVNNIDKESPEAPILTQDITSWTNGNVKVMPQYPVSDKSVNMLNNGDFLNGLEHWSSNVPDDSVTLTNINTPYGKGVRVTKTMGNEYYWALTNNTPNKYKTGKTYIFSWYYKVIEGKGRPYFIGWWINDNGGYKQNLPVREVDLENGWKYAEASYTFTDDYSLTGATFLNSMPNNVIAEFANVRLTENTMEYKIGLNGNWVPYVNPINLTSNTTIYARYKDIAGNISPEGKLIVSNIDKTQANLTLTQTPAELTNGNVTLNISATDTQSGIKQIILPDNGIINNSTASYTVSTNGEYVVKAIDNAGNITTKSINVSNIDKQIPIVNIENNTNWTNKDIQVNITAVDDRTSGIAKIEYKLSGSTIQPWTTYSDNLFIKNEGITTITARSFDKAGNTSLEKSSQTKIDKTKPINGVIKIELK